MEATLYALRRISDQKFVAHTPETCCDEEMHEFGSLRNATMDVEQVIEELRNGMLSKEDLEVVELSVKVVGVRLPA